MVLISDFINNEKFEATKKDSESHKKKNACPIKGCSEVDIEKWAPPEENIKKY